MFDSRYGNTEKIATDIAMRLKQYRIDATCRRTTEVELPVR